ncbi:MAG: hypothetical protein ACFFAX_05045 [Promethearchaeota archaeon]
MQEMEHHRWKSFEEREEKTIEEVGFWTNVLTSVLSLSWMVTIFFYCCVSGAAPSFHIDVGSQMAPYLWASGSLTCLWLMNKIYSKMLDKRAITV